MIIEIPEDNSIIRWKYKDEWKCAEISDLIVVYEKQSKGECMKEVRKLLDKIMEIDKVIQILAELWQCKETDKYTNEEINIAIETAISYLAVIRNYD